MNCKSFVRMRAGLGKSEILRSKAERRPKPETRWLNLLTLVVEKWWQKNEEGGVKDGAFLGLRPSDLGVIAHFARSLVIRLDQSLGRQPREGIVGHQPQPWVGLGH